MKKRLLSALLALALVFVLLPTTALADTTPVTDENVKINGTPVTVGNGISLGEGNGTYSYDKSTRTLTLNNATITATGNIGISFGVPVKGNIDYKIELIGTNTISSTSAQAIYVEYDSDLDQQGTQKLSTLTINGSAGSQLILNASGYEKEAIWSKGDFTLSGGTAVTAFSSGEIAVNVGSMTINNSKLSAQSSSYGTTVVLYGFEMIGDAAEFEALNTSSGVRAVLRTSGASENIDWSKYQLITGSYSGNALTKSEPTVCDKNTLNELFSSSSTTRYIHIAKRTIPALQRTSDVLIAGENAVVGQWTDIPAATGTGSYSYDADKKELTLKDVNITSGINAIQFMANGAYTIKLEGENKISNVSNGISLSDDQYITSLNVTITGTGSLDISAKGLAINMKKGDLKFENTGAIKLATSSIELNNNALSVKGNITITDMSKYSVTGTQQTGGKPLGSEVSLTEASQLKGGTTGYRIITITRGDEVARTESPVVIDGHTLLNDTYYTINGSTVAEGTESNYNAFYNSTTKTLELNNASINGTGVKAIEANVGGYTFTIELVGNNIIKTSGSANNVIDITGNLYFTGSGTAEVSGKGTPIYATYKIDVSADVTITNTEKAGSFTFSAYGENSSNYKGANTFAIGTGYTAYATTDKTTWAVYDNTTASENESYTTLRITTQPPETGGSTHQHVWDEAWHDTGDYHHAHQCTICKAYDTTTQEPHNVTGHRDNLDGSHSNICGSCGYSAKVSHSYTWAPNANDNEKHIGTCVCGNVVERYHNFVGDVCSDCGYDKSTGTTCEHVWTTEWTIDTVDNEYHWHKCIKCNAITDKKPHAYTIVTDSGTNHIRECECKVFYVEDHISSDWIIDTPATATTAGSMHKECTVCKHKMQTEVIPATGEIEPPTPDNPGTIVIIRPAEEEKPAQQPNPSTGANDLVGLAVAAAVAAALGSAALLRKHD